MLHDRDLVSIQEVRGKVEAAWSAFQQFRAFTQDKVDAIVEAMAAAGRAESRRLAELAVSETGYGNVESKIAKNLLCADLLPKRIRGMKTIGLVHEDAALKIVEIAEPVGVVAAILPTTNPTSTAIYKSIIAVKAGNAVVLSPHPRARACTCATAEVMIRSAEAAGAPQGLIQCLGSSTIEGTNALMRHPRTSVILSTGGSGIVKAAYSSGKPAFGVGPGNVPVLIDESAKLSDAVRKVVAGKSFDFGTVCSSEQTVVAVAGLREPILSELRNQKAYLCRREQSNTLAKVLLNERLLVNPDCVGQSPQKIAKMAGFEVSADTSILAVEIDGVGKEHPLSAEKLSPVLSLYFVPDFAAALDACEGILRLGGLGHTCVIYSENRERTLEYARRMPAFRVLVNTPSPHGSTGITTNVQPAMTLGCGAIAGNSTSDNIGPQHLLNLKRVAWEVRPDRPAADESGLIASAVERYLASRGVASRKEKGSGNVVADVVDRFLETKASANKPEPVSAGICCAGPVASAQPAEPEKPAVAIVDFVCENDVRQAIRESRKIFIGPKTIVTPSARDLASSADILVLAKR